MSAPRDALALLKETSRTFAIPIARLPGDGLRQAVTAAYLCMRAIDEVEDHPTLDICAKAATLRMLGRALQSSFDAADIAAALETHRGILPEVTLRLHEWTQLAPAPIAPRIWDAAAAMAERMALWVERGWTIDTVQDLDGYTFSVAGAVGLLLSDLWMWHGEVRTDRRYAVGFGCGPSTSCGTATRIWGVGWISSREGGARPIWTRMPAATWRSGTRITPRCRRARCATCA